MAFFAWLFVPIPVIILVCVLVSLFIDRKSKNAVKSEGKTRKLPGILIWAAYAISIATPILVLLAYMNVIPGRLQLILTNWGPVFLFWWFILLIALYHLVDSKGLEWQERWKIANGKNGGHFWFGVWW